MPYNTPLTRQKTQVELAQSALLVLPSSKYTEALHQLADFSIKRKFLIPAIFTHAAPYFLSQYRQGLMLDFFTPLDILAVTWFFAVWFLYSYISKKMIYRGDRITLDGLSSFYRETWMLNMVNRNNRVVDSNLLNTLLHSVSFFLSGTILVIAGLYASLGSASNIIELTSHVPFAVENTIAMVKIKFLILICLFVYVFFKLVWSLRLYNYGIVMMGAAPEHDTRSDEKERYARKMGVVLSRGGIYFNEGMRGFEFGLAYLVWLIHPLGLIISTTIVLLVIYRREYRSATLAAMQRWDDEKAK